MAAIAPSALPPPTAVPVSAEMRLAYVLQHFRLAYSEVPAVTIGYADAKPAITVAEGAGSFFQLHEPYPPAPHLREWAGQQVPFFFDKHPEAPLLVLGENRATIGADIISAAFYLLSGWQEYFSDARDQHGRFPYAASVQKQYGFVAMPVVNYYFEVLKTAIEHVTGQPLPLRKWPGDARFAAFISHDIDTLHSAWKAPAKNTLKQGKLFPFGQLLWRRLTRPDAWDNLEAVAAATAHFGASSTFFILPNRKRSAGSHPNADYAFTSNVARRFQALADQGCELALHGSFGTATNTAQLRGELARLAPARIHGNRFHYLCWEPRLTPVVLDEIATSSIGYDTTLGFAEHFGFRHSYCHPFYPFNFRKGTSHKFLEIPLQVMDATLHHINYLQLTPEEIVPALQPVFAEIAKFGGVATVLWHNDHFDSANTVTGPRQFAQIMEDLQQRQASFLTGGQIMAEIRHRQALT